MPKRRFVYIDGEEVEITDPSKLTKAQKKWCKDNSVKIEGVKGVRLSATWPMTSIAAGVSAEQRQEAIDTSIAMGVPTDFNADGDAVFRSPGHKREYLRARGLYDRNAGYGDTPPQNG